MKLVAITEEGISKLDELYDWLEYQIRLEEDRGTTARLILTRRKLEELAESIVIAAIKTGGGTNGTS